MVKVLIMFVLGYFIYRSTANMVRAILRDNRSNPVTFVKKPKEPTRDRDVEDARWVDIKQREN